jgi:cell division transport system ATP-binding protein
MIIFQKVTKKFPDGTVALDDISLQVNPKEFVFFVGPSGAGKTTIMRLLRREILPTQGNIVVQDKNLSELKNKDVPQLRRKISMCFQDFKLLYDRTVLENITLSLEILGLTNDKINRRVKEVLKKVSLEKKANLFPVQISGGELQRVGIARAIALEPDILIADEPTGNLDPQSGWEIIKLFKEINLSGTTVLVATHNVDIVDRFKERVIRLDKGKLISDHKKGKYK